MLFCKFCSKECKNKNSLINHERLCKCNPSRVPSWLELNRNSGTFTHYNQYTKPGSNWTHSEESRKKMSLKARGRLHTEEYKEKMRILAHERKLGGHTSKKRMDYVTKSGEVVHLQSSYEVRFAQLLDLLHIEWIRPTYMLWNDNGTVRRYYPDFKVGNMYFDTKNSYLAKKDARKMNEVRRQNDVVLHLVLEEDINKEQLLLWLSGDSTCLVSRNG